MSLAHNLDQVTHGRHQPNLGSETEFYLEQLVEGYSEKMEMRRHKHTDLACKFTTKRAKPTIQLPLADTPATTAQVNKQNNIFL